MRGWITGLAMMSLAGPARANAAAVYRYTDATIGGTLHSAAIGDPDAFSLQSTGNLSSSNELH